MSQNEKWKADIKAIIMETVPIIVDEKLKALTPPTTTSPPSSEHEHEHTEQKNPHDHNLEDVFDCPDCAPKIIQKAIEKEKKKRGELEFVCETCGTGVKEDEPECIFCGGTEARKRSS